MSDGQVHGIGRGHVAKQVTPDCRLNLTKPHTLMPSINTVWTALQKIANKPHTKVDHKNITEISHKHKVNWVFSKHQAPAGDAAHS